MAHAQTFTDHVQKNSTGTAKVTINQSKEIDELVNGASTSPQTDTRLQQPAAAAPKTQQATTPARKPEDVHTATTHNADSSKRQAEEATPRQETRLTTTPSHEARTETRTETAPVIDTSKKVMRGAQKVKGYRVQVFAGGNTRADSRKPQRPEMP